MQPQCSEHEKLRMAHDAARTAYLATVCMLGDGCRKVNNFVSDLKKASSALEAMPHCEALQDEVLRLQDEVSQAMAEKSQTSEKLDFNRQKMFQCEYEMGQALQIKTQKNKTQLPGPGAKNHDSIPCILYTYTGLSSS
jgi:hypothetical protein